MIVIRAKNMAEAKRVAEADPFHKQGFRKFRIPGVGRERRRLQRPRKILRRQFHAGLNSGIRVKSINRVTGSRCISVIRIFSDGMGLRIGILCTLAIAVLLPVRGVAQTGQIPQIPAFLPTVDQVTASQAMPLDGTWLINTIRKKNSHRGGARPMRLMAGHICSCSTSSPAWWSSRISCPPVLAPTKRRICRCWENGRQRYSRTGALPYRWQRP